MNAKLHLETNLLRSLMLLTLCISLAACGGRSTVVTQDDSAEYRNAQTLPPLKKPSATRPAPSVTPAPARPAPTQTATSAPTAVPAPVAQANSGLAPKALGVVSAQVVERKNGGVALQINGGPDAAWEYLRSNLNKSDITVHTRNKSAGRFAIGCTGIDVEEPVSVTKKGGWSIFKRTTEEGDHCSLQLQANKNSALVTAYDRNGQLVSAELAQSLYSRLLNN